MKMLCRQGKLHKCCCRTRTRLERRNRGDPIPERMASPGATPSDESPPSPDRTWRQGKPVLAWMKDLAGGAWHRCRGWAASARIALAALVVNCLTVAASFGTRTTNGRTDGEGQEAASPSSDHPNAEEVDSNNNHNNNTQTLALAGAGNERELESEPGEPTSSHITKPGVKHRGSLPGSSENEPPAKHRPGSSRWFSKHKQPREERIPYTWDQMFNHQRKRAKRLKWERKTANRQSLSLQDPTKGTSHSPRMHQEQKEERSGDAIRIGHRRRPSDFPASLNSTTSPDQVRTSSCRRSPSDWTSTRTPAWGRAAGWAPMTVVTVLCLLLLSTTSATVQKSTSTSSWGLLGGNEPNTAEYDLDAREIDPQKIHPRGFVAYDCNDVPSPNRTSDLQVRAIDLTRVDECPELETDYLPMRNMTVTLVQSNVPVRIKVSRCIAKITKTYTRHGWDSAIHHTKPLVIAQVIDLGGDICVELRREGKFACPPDICGPGDTYSPKLNVTDRVRTDFSWYLKGGVTPGYTSKDEYFHQVENNVRLQKYGNIHAHLTLWTDELEANLDVRTLRVWSDEIQFYGDYTTGGSFHREHGTFGWDYIPKEVCDHSLARITEEPHAAVYQMKPHLRSGGGQFEYAGSMIVIKNHTIQRASGLVAKASPDPCITSCLQTNIPDLTVCISEEAVAAARTLPSIEDRPLTRFNRLNLRGMGTYLDMQSRLGDAELHQQLAAEMCALDMRMIKADFASLLSGNQYAIQALTLTNPDRLVKGQTNSSVFSVSVRGSVAYLLECQPITVRPVGIPICTQQLPVALPSGKLGFVDAINLHLIGFPTPTECTEAMPVQFIIGETRFCQSPGEIRPCASDTAPTVLKPMVGRARGIQFSDLEALGGLLFTEEEMNKLRQTRREIEWGPSSYSVLAQKAFEQSIDSSGQPNSLHLGFPLSARDLDFLTDKVKVAMFALYGLFGQVIFHLITFTVFSVMLSHYFGCAARLYYLYKIRGCGVWAIPACGVSIVSIVFLPVLILMGIINTTKQSLKEFRLAALPPPQYHRNIQMLKDHIEVLKTEIRQIRATQIEIEEGRRCGAEIPIDKIKTLLYPAGHGRHDDNDDEQETARKKETQPSGNGVDTSGAGSIAPYVGIASLGTLGEPLLLQGNTLMQHLPWLRTSSPAGSSSSSVSESSPRPEEAPPGANTKQE